MYRPKFCVECGEPLARKVWRAWTSGRLCGDCRQRSGKPKYGKSLGVIAAIAIIAFILGRSMRPAPPPLIIQRAANSPLTDLPADSNDASRERNGSLSISRKAASNAQTVDDAIYICGARTKKGTPCHRRVHSPGERCFQHKGMPAILPIEKLVIKP